MLVLELELALELEVVEIIEKFKKCHGGRGHVK